MKLEFKILWIDDSNAWVDTVKDDIKDIIEERGLISEITVKNNIAESKEYLESNCDVFDLILVDYQLGKNTKTKEDEYGNNLINLIRQKKIYSNIIFYSTDEDSLRKIRGDEKLQGVYIFSRTELQIDNLEESLVPLIDFLIKRDLDVASLRGISTSTVAYFDEQFKKIIEKYIPCDDIIKKIETNAKRKERKRKELFEKIQHVPNIKKSLKDNEFDSKDLDEILSTKFLESSARYECVIHHLKNNTIEELKSEELSSYQKEILKYRNELAHTFEEDPFTEQEKIKILKYLSKYKKIFDKFS